MLLALTVITRSSRSLRRIVTDLKACLERFDATEDALFLAKSIADLEEIVGGSMKFTSRENTGAARKELQVAAVALENALQILRRHTGNEGQ